MEELVQRLSAAAGIDQETAAKAAGLVFGFLQKEGPADEVNAVFGKLPGAQDLIDKAGGGGDGGMGLMGLAGQLTEAGIGMGDMTTVGKEIFAFVREKVGEDEVGAIVGAIPGLSQFV